MRHHKDVEKITSNKGAKIDELEADVFKQRVEDLAERINHVSSMLFSRMERFMIDPELFSQMVEPSFPARDTAKYFQEVHSSIDNINNAVERLVRMMDNLAL